MGWKDSVILMFSKVLAYSSFVWQTFEWQFWDCHDGIMDLLIYKYKYINITDTCVPALAHWLSTFNFANFCMYLKWPVSINNKHKCGEIKKTKTNIGITWSSSPGLLRRPVGTGWEAILRFFLTALWTRHGSPGRCARRLASAVTSGWKLASTRWAALDVSTGLTRDEVVICWERL